MPGTCAVTPASFGLRGANPVEPPLRSCAGVRKGDPLGPLLFALVLLPALEQLATHHADVPCSAYADDIVLQGKPEICTEGAVHPSGTAGDRCHVPCLHSY